MSVKLHRRCAVQGGPRTRTPHPAPGPCTAHPTPHNHAPRTPHPTPGPHTVNPAPHIPTPHTHTQTPHRAPCTPHPHPKPHTPHTRTLFPHNPHTPAHATPHIRAPTHPHPAPAHHALWDFCSPGAGGRPPVGGSWRRGSQGSARTCPRVRWGPGRVQTRPTAATQPVSLQQVDSIYRGLPQPKSRRAPQGRGPQEPPLHRCPH